ncbi:MAG: selenium-dependent molybdenum cofactor biosynthesis protein YqeB [Schaedlerella sp.]|nr:selenium-dependent molybdenum cofactor biosynthesis protein YqeB [Schaedlerella sp.]
MKVLIKGAGDLATGIAVRLYNSGHQILMTEIPEPMTVRRYVAFSRAVYENEADVEGVHSELASSYDEAQNIIANGNIAVMIDPKAAVKNEFKPDVIVDAILAKYNTGTTIEDAPFVLGIGPGFTAGEDCHCIIETKRGHTLGTLIWKGTAIPNTGVPGNVGGYTLERLIKASADGIMEPVAHISDQVKEGQIVAYTGGEPVYALMSGVVRGMLQDDVQVTKGLKIGDIDARCEVSHCFTISDKARAIGGGALEAVTQFERMQKKYAVVVLAAGGAKRFGSNKLLAYVSGEQIYERMLKKLKGFTGFERYIVTGYEEIRDAAEAVGVQSIENKDVEKGISLSLSLGLKKCLENNPDIQGVLFTVCDQPNLTFTTMWNLMRQAMLHPGKVICASHGQTLGNPVLWDRKYFSELLELGGDVGGKSLLSKHYNEVVRVDTQRIELHDIDRREELHDFVAL